MANLTISIAGSAMVRELDAHHRWARFFGYCINMAFTANMPIILSMVASNVAGFTKKSTANSMVCLADSRLSSPAQRNVSILIVCF